MAKHILYSAIGACLLSLTGPASAAAIGTAITYQGELRRNGSPVSGDFDMRFSLHDALVAGSPVGSLAQRAVIVNDGVFTAELDFGAVFDGTQLWLQIEVRPDDNVSPYTILDPRQKLTAAPFAIHVLNGGAGDGHSLDAADGDPVDAVYVSSEGHVGIGTTTPGYRLAVDGTGNEVYAVMSEDGTQTPDNLSVQIAPGGGSANSRIGYVLGNFGSSLGFLIGNGRNAPLRFATGNGLPERMRIDADGKVGIGTTTPATALGVNGTVTAAAFVGDGSGLSGLPVSPWSLTGSDAYYNGGNVGIGTSTPGYRLTVDGTGNEVYAVMSEDGTQTPDNLTVQIAPGGGSANSRIGYLLGSFGNSLGFLIGNGRNAPLRFATGNGLPERVRIDANGNVGIGTSGPTERLDVAGNIRATGSVCAANISCPSDTRYKTNVRPLGDAVELIKALRPVRFDWKREQFPDRHFTEDHQIGLIAQQVKEILPEVVSQNGDGFYSVDYGRLTPLLIEAVKEQQQSIERQRTQIEEKDAQLAEQRDRLVELECRFARIEQIMSQAAVEKQDSR